MIKEYTDEYYNDVLSLGRELNENYKFSLNAVSKCYVYFSGDELVGFILADIFDDRAEIIDIVVMMLYRNKKIGDKLLKCVIEMCKNKGCENITLEVRVNNKPALKLYKNNDFKIVSVRKKYYSNGTVDAYLMSRKL